MIKKTSEMYPPSLFSSVIQRGTCYPVPVSNRTQMKGKMSTTGTK
jgi:hypothetical protein